MSARATWSPEFQQIITWLTTASPLVRTEALAVVQDETEAAARELAARWPTRSGKLRRSIRTEYPSSTVIVGKVRATSPSAHLLFGTKDRVTRSGARRGRMPDDDTLVTIARARRDRIGQRLRDLVERNGFTVKG